MASNFHLKPEAQPRSTSYAFPAGIPAFETHSRFRLVENPAFAPIMLLESELDPAVRFACAPVALIVDDYRFELSEEEMELLGHPSDTASLLVLAILTFREGRPPTANLLAPVVLNPATATGVQSVQCGASWPVMYPLREETSCS
ncbi:MAG: flagellar assembly protein FliW [Bryobacteraceae bacterium]